MLRSDSDSESVVYRVLKKIAAVGSYYEWVGSWDIEGKDGMGWE